MKGTEKQIAWAQDIKREALEKIEKNIALNAERYEEYDHHRLYAANIEAHKIMRAVLNAIFSVHDDAEYIIDHRAILTNYSTTVDRWAELILTGKKTAAQIAAQNGIKDYKEA